MARKPLYGTISFFGSSWSVTHYEERHGDGSSITSCVEGYGEFPFEEYPGLPVIDFKGNDAVIDALAIPDNKRPQEASHRSYGGTLTSYLSAIRGLGIKIHNDLK